MFLGYAVSTQETYRDRLRVNELLIDLSEEDFSAFEERCEYLERDEGFVFIQEGEVQKYTYFVLEGAVRIVLGTQDGVNVNFNDIQTDGWFGELSAIDKQERSATAFAMAPTVVAAVPSNVFLNLILDKRVVALKILRSMANALRRSNQKITTVSSFSGVQRVYMELMKLGEPSPNGDGTWLIGNLPSHDFLAEGATTSKDTVARAMSQLFQAGVAKRERGKLRIMDREQLKRLATQA